MKNSPSNLRKMVFIPSFFLILFFVALGLFNNTYLTQVAKAAFAFSLRNFGWLYQLTAMGAWLLILTVLLSKFSHIRLGGIQAKPRFSFLSWFAMALTGGIASGLLVYGVNEPIIYFGNIYGELEQLGIPVQSKQAALFAISRSFYNWSFIPYAIYSVSGLLAAYMYFNRGAKLTVSATLSPILGRYSQNKLVQSVVDVMALLAMALGLASSLGIGMTLIGSGLSTQYGFTQSTGFWLVLATLITFIFTFAAVTGIDKGIKYLADVNMWVFYGILMVLLLLGPTVEIFNTSVSAIGLWLHNFWSWGLDSATVGGEPLVMWWTLYDWAIWIAYAPLMGLFLAKISYGRTIREFLLINWLLPATFGLVWFAIWGITALDWQISGQVNLVNIIKQHGAVSGLWGFLQALPLGWLLIPVLIITLILSFSTAADVMVTTISSLCVNEDATADGEAPAYQKILWGVSIGCMAFLMVAFAGGVQGIDGVKYLAAAGGFVVLFIFILQLASLTKLFLSASATQTHSPSPTTAEVTPHD